MRILGSVLICLFAFIASAQQSTINGKDHPELISNEIAYRVIMISHSRAADPTDITAGGRKRAGVNLAVADLGIYEQVLNDFRARYDPLVADHNRFVEGSWSLPRATRKQEQQLFQEALAALVESARLQLALRLSPQGAARLDAFVQSEKSKMVVGQ